METFVLPVNSELAMSKDEIHELINSLQAKVFTGSITLDSIIRYPWNKERIDLFVIPAHGTPEGIPLEDGRILGYDILSSLLDQSRAKYLVLMSCSSEKLGFQISGLLGFRVSILTTLGDIEVSTASAATITFCRKISEGVDIKEAFRFVQRTFRQFHFITSHAGDHMSDSSSSPHHSRVENSLQIELMRTRTEVQEIRDFVMGGGLHRKGLLSSIEEIEQRISRIEGTISKISSLSSESDKKIQSIETLLSTRVELPPSTEIPGWVLKLGFVFIGSFLLLIWWVLRLIETGVLRIGG